jgi:hypothetical protein
MKSKGLYARSYEWASHEPAEPRGHGSRGDRGQQDRDREARNALSSTP